MEGEPEGTLTVKYREATARFKSRREIELRVGTPGRVPDVLALMGFRVEWFYEKIRECWRYRGCSVALDELPLVGCFIEVEGPDEETIDAILAELGLDPGAHVEESYFGLFRRYCAERGLPFGNLRFSGPPPIEAPAP
jgi:adenylate cyclase class 2